ncbi:MAG TPA: hypothetical protein VIY08_14680 [Candidatus Nitrosocosmicus sp.]
MYATAYGGSNTVLVISSSFIFNEGYTQTNNLHSSKNHHQHDFNTNITTSINSNFNSFKHDRPLKHNTSVANSNFNSFNNNGHNTYLNHQSQNSYNLQTPMCLTVLVLVMQTAIHYKICTMDLIDDIV